MAIIEIYGEIQQRADTTSQWNSVNPVLEQKQLGWEYNNNTDKIPVGVKMGDGTRTWAQLPYWFTVSSGKLVISVPSGSAIPMNVPLTGVFRLGFDWYADVVVNSTTDRSVNDIYIDKKFTNSGKTVIDSIDIYGHGSGTTSDDLKVTLYV